MSEVSLVDGHIDNGMTWERDTFLEELKTAKSEEIKDVLLTLETAVEESNKYIREYEDSKEQRAYNQAFKDAYNLVKEMTESK